MQARLMALHSWVVVAVAVATLVVVAGPASAQYSSDCLTFAPNMLAGFCSSYLTDASVLSPGQLCCYEVVSVTTTYGPDCLCQVILEVQANPSLQVGFIHGRAYSLASDCNAPANMSACTACCSANSPLAGTPPGTSTSTSPGVSTPPGVSTSPGVSTPTFQVPAAPVSRSKASTGALVGGSVGGVSVLGIILFILYKCLDNSKIDIKWDVNAPCWCCQRREKNPHPINGGTAKVPNGAYA